MDLNTYIKQNQLNPNPAMLSQLGASQELINYLLYTPENTNFGMFDSIGENNTAEIWFTGTTSEQGDFGDENNPLTVNPNITEQQLIDLNNNPGKYLIYVNDILLSCNEIFYDYLNISTRISATYGINAGETDEIWLSTNNDSDSGINLPLGCAYNLPNSAIEIKVALAPNDSIITINLTTDETNVVMRENSVNSVKNVECNIANFVSPKDPYIGYSIETADITSGAGEAHSYSQSVTITAQTDVTVDLTFILAK